MLTVIVIIIFSSAHVAIYHYSRRKLSGWSLVVRLCCPLGFASGGSEGVTEHHGMAKPDIPRDDLLERLLTQL